MDRQCPTLTTVLNAVTATTTSAAQACKNAVKISLYFTRADHGSGNTVFSVSVSGDDSTYITYNKLITNTANTNAQDLTRVASVTLSSDTTSMVSLDLQDDVISSFKVIATETTDGTHTCKALTEY